MVRSWRGFGVLPASRLTPNVLRSNKQTNKQSEKMERFHQLTFITVTQQGQSGTSRSLSPPSPHHTRIDSFLKGNTFSCTKIPSFFYFQSDCCRTLPVMTETIGELPWNTPPGRWKVFFYLLRDYFKGKSNARNVLSLLTIKQSMEITLIKVNLAWLGHNRRGIY